MTMNQNEIQHGKIDFAPAGCILPPHSASTEKQAVQDAPKHQPIQFQSFVGESQEIQRVFEIIQKVAPSDSTVLITGDSGTGKELAARALHATSKRRNNPLIILNCGAIPGELLESELFGHEKGAFTGAHQTRIGRFERADGGTIFLDEIGDMSPNLQVKLLRVIQEQQFERVGGTKTIQVNIRIISATNSDLKKAMQEGKFREDLFYRLNVIPIHMPPLCERRSDIPLLIEHFLHKIGNHEAAKRFSSEALAAMQRYDWPGNIRELENLVERLSVLVENPVIQKSDLPEKIRAYQPAAAQDTIASFPNGVSFNHAVNHFQKQLILHALNQTNWVKAKAAAMLKINRTTLVEKIKKMDLETEQQTFYRENNAQVGLLGAHYKHFHEVEQIIDFERFGQKCVGA